MTYQFVIRWPRLTPATKKTGQRIATRQDGSSFILSSKRNEKWSEIAAILLRSQWRGRKPLEGPVQVTALIYRERDTGDLCGFLQAIGDVLEAPTKKSSASTRRRKAGIIRNDSQIDSFDESRRLIDRDDPRVEISITEL